MSRRGGMMIELVVAGILAGALLVVCLQLLSGVLAQRRASDMRQCALMELDNIMERLTARPWDELTADSLSREKLSSWATRQLPGAELKIAVTTPSDDPNAKRIAASLRWQDRSGRLLAPMILTTWKYNLSIPQQPTTEN